MEDIMSIMKNNPLIDLDEDVEYTIERYDSRAN
jgi:hypothetical protein